MKYTFSSSVGLHLETAGCAGECRFMLHRRRWMLLYCASLCWTYYSCDKCDINPHPSEPRYWREQSDSRLPSDVTLDWLETPPCRAAAAACTALLWNYLLLRNHGGLIHERQLCQGLWTQESLNAFVLISSLITDYLLECSSVTILLKSKLIINFFSPSCRWAVFFNVLKLCN